MPRGNCGHFLIWECRGRGAPPRSKRCSVLVLVEVDEAMSAFFVCHLCLHVFKRISPGERIFCSRRGLEVILIQGGITPDSLTRFYIESDDDQWNQHEHSEVSGFCFHNCFIFLGFIYGERIVICSFFSRESAGEKVDLMKKSATRKLRALWLLMRSGILLGSL